MRRRLYREPQSVAIQIDSTITSSSKKIVRINQQPEEADPVSCVFIASEVESHDNASSKIYHVMVPRSEHSNPESYDAKVKELKNFEDYDGYEVVD